MPETTLLDSDVFETIGVEATTPVKPSGDVDGVLLSVSDLCHAGKIHVHL